MAGHLPHAVSERSPFGAALGGGFSTSGRELARTFEVLGETIATESHGFRILSDDTDSAEALKKIEDALTPPAESSPTETRDSQHFVFVSKDAEFIDYWANEVRPADDEMCVFIHSSDGSLSENVTFAIGQSLQNSFQKYLGPNGSVAIRDGLSDFISAEFNRNILSLTETGHLALDSWENSTSTLRFLGFFEALIAPVLNILGNMPKHLNFEAVERAIYNSFQDVITKETSRLLKAKNDAQLVFADHSEQLFDLVTSHFSWFLDYLPAHDLAISFLIEQMQAYYADSRFLKMVVAHERFKQAIAESLLSKDNLSKILLGNVDSLQKNQQQIGELVIGGAFVGTTAFVIGTVYQIIFDIVNAFVQIIKYGGKGLNYAYQAISDAVTAEPEEGLIEASPSLISEIFPPFDTDKFISETLPTLLEDLYSFTTGIIDDFIGNAEKYGQMVGDYLASTLGKALSGALNFFLEKYDSNASMLQRLWYVIRQWFRAGALIGPILVDIALLFCSGGLAGPASAAAKIGKIDKLGDALKFAKVGTKTFTQLSHFQSIIKKIPRRMIKVIQELIEQLWRVVGPVLNQVKGWFAKAHKALEGRDNLPDMETVAEMIDNWYGRCATLNFFIAIVVMFTGQGEVNSKGQLTLAK